MTLKLELRVFFKSFKTSYYLFSIRFCLLHDKVSLHNSFNRFFFKLMFLLLLLF